MRTTIQGSAVQNQFYQCIALEQPPMPADCLHDMTHNRMSIDMRTDIGLVRVRSFTKPLRLVGWLKHCILSGAEHTPGWPKRRPHTPQPLGLCIFSEDFDTNLRDQLFH